VIPNKRVRIMGVVTGAALIGALAITSLAAACDNEALRLELRSAQLPDCRAYEIVTPAFKAGVALNAPLISHDGSRLLASATGGFSGAERSTAGGIGIDLPIGVMYELNRGATGWSTKPVPPPPASEYPTGGMQSNDAGSDLRTMLWRLRAPSQPEGEADLYRRENGGRFIHMGPLQPASIGPLFGGEGTYVGASQDMTHVLIRKEPRNGRWPGDTTAATTGTESLYEYAGENEPEPQLVAIQNEGRLASNTEAQLISQCGAELGSGLAGTAYNAISSSGASLVFTALACGTPSVNELYARVDEAHTVALSEPILPPGQCTGSCEVAEHRAGSFVGASEDGSKVFFTTEQPLLNRDKDTTNDLYTAELAGSTLTRVVMISEGDTSGAAAEQDQTPGEGANVAGVVRVAADGSHIYFVATGVLTGAANAVGAKAQPGANNLYVTDTATGRTRFVGNIDSTADPASATPDGDVLVIVTSADLTAEQGVAGAQIYRYDALSGSLKRISIGQHSTSPSLAPAIVASSYLGFDRPSQAQSTLTMSNDGSYVFFESPDALTPHALDDQAVGCQFEIEGKCLVPAFAANVYEYHQGRVSLIVTARPIQGQGPLLSTDAAGTDLFFTTEASLASTDTDTEYDIYDARVNGGFPPTAEPLSCSADACRESLSPWPQLLAPGTATQSGGDNLPSHKVLPKPPTTAQRLAAALRTCRASHPKIRRRCEAAARRRFRPHAKAKPAKAKPTRRGK
jgi:hypothetical protein